jgi:hypothetical protein
MPARNRNSHAALCTMRRRTDCQGMGRISTRTPTASTVNSTVA